MFPNIFGMENLIGDYLLDDLSLISKAQDTPTLLVPYLHDARFYEVAKLAFFQVDHTMISTLVEHWRPKAHTFHMS